MNEGEFQASEVICVADPVRVRWETGERVAPPGILAALGRSRRQRAFVEELERLSTLPGAEKFLRELSTRIDHSLGQIEAQRRQVPRAGRGVRLVTDPDRYPPPTGAGGGSGVEWKRKSLRLSRLCEALDQEGKPYDISPGEENTSLLRGQEYHCVIVGGRTTILVCDREGEATFVIHGLLPEGAAFTKDDLRGGIMEVQCALNPALGQALDAPAHDVEPGSVSVSSGVDLRGVHMVICRSEDQWLADIMGLLDHQGPSQRDPHFYYGGRWRVQELLRRLSPSSASAQRQAMKHHAGVAVGFARTVDEWHIGTPEELRRIAYGQRPMDRSYYRDSEAVRHDLEAYARAASRTPEALSVEPSRGFNPYMVCASRERVCWSTYLARAAVSYGLCETARGGARHHYGALCGLKRVAGVAVIEEPTYPLMDRAYFGTPSYLRSDLEHFASVLGRSVADLTTHSLKGFRIRCANGEEISGYTYLQRASRVLMGTEGQTLQHRIAPVLEQLKELYDQAQTEGHEQQAPPMSPESFQASVEARVLEASADL